MIMDERRQTVEGDGVSVRPDIKAKDRMKELSAVVTWVDLVDVGNSDF